MPALIAKKVKKQTLYYIVENKRIEGKLHRDYLKSLGVCTKTEVKVQFANFTALNKHKEVKGLTLNKAYLEYRKLYEQQIGNGVKQRTFDTFVYAMNKILEMLGNELLSEIDFSKIEAVKLDLVNKDKFSARTINIHLTELSKLLKFGYQKKWISSLPEIKRVPEVNTNKQIDTLSREEIEALLEVANDSQSLYLQLMLFAGLRPNEALRLLWKDVNLKDGYIEVLSDNKLKRGRRVPMHSRLQSIFETVPRVNEFVSPFRDSKYASRSMKRLEKRTGIKCNPYKLRKTFGSILVQTGTDSIFIAKLMGHASIQTTYQYYLNLKDEQLQNAISSI